MPHGAASEVKAVLSASAQSATVGQNSANSWADVLAAGLELAAITAVRMSQGSTAPGQALLTGAATTRLQEINDQVMAR